MPKSSLDIFTAGASYIDAIMEHCERKWDDFFYISDAVILVTGGLANVALLWLLLRERKSLSASKVLGVNLAAMDLIYLSILPVSLVYYTGKDKQVNSNYSVFSETTWQQHNFTQDPMEEAKKIFSMFNMIGCPLLLACMCIERYLAVVKPVLYLRARKWEYRMAVSAAVWAITLCFCLAAGLLYKGTIVIIPVTISLACLFLLMLFCLGGVVWALQQQSPAHTTSGNQARSESPLKRQAVVNVLVVVVPAVMAYLPILMILPLFLYIYFWNTSLNEGICDVFQLARLSPMFGVLIGPLFYLSKARQICCLIGRGKTFNE